MLLLLERGKQIKRESEREKEREREREPESNSLRVCSVLRSSQENLTANLLFSPAYYSQKRNPEALKPIKP